MLVCLYVCVFVRRVCVNVFVRLSVRLHVRLSCLAFPFDFRCLIVCRCVPSVLI